MKTHRKILHLLHERSEQAIAELNRNYATLCRSIAGRILANQQDVEETVSDTMLTVWNHIPPDNPVSLPAYISRITRNIALDRLRMNNAQMRDDRLSVALTELETCLPAPDTPETILERQVITDTINAYLATLDKKNRLIFVSRYYLMESTKEIAQKTGMTDQAIRSRLLRMRAQLREHLNKEGIIV